MDPKFIKSVQASGWHIEAVTDNSVIAKCPSVGCNLRAELKLGGYVPDVDPNQNRDLIDRKVETYDDIRVLLRERRENLLLSIREVEEIAGLETDHLAKIERNDHNKIPNVQTLLEWSESLGFEIVLRPRPMTSYALRTICDTRDRAASRSKRMKLENTRRRGKDLRRA